MDSPHASRNLLLGLLFVGLCLLGPLPGMGQTPSVRTDYVGDPLPEGAIYRLGTARLRHPGAIDVLLFSDDGKSLVAVGWGTMPSAWDVETGKRIQTDATEFELLNKATGKSVLARINPALWSSVAFGVEGKTLLAVSYDDVVTAWDIESGKATSKEEMGLVATLHEDRKSSKKSTLVRFLDPLTGQEKQQPIRLSYFWEHSNTWSLAGDGKHLAVQYWSSGERREIDTGKKTALAEGGVFDLRATLKIPEKKLAVISSWDYVGVQNLDDKEFIWTKEVAPPNAGGRLMKTCKVTCLALSPDGTVVAAGTDNGHIDLLDLATGERAGGSRLHPGFFSGPIRFVPGGKFILVTMGREAVLWNLSEGRKVRGFGVDYTEYLHVSPDGQSLLVPEWSGKAYDQLSLQETVSGKKLWTLGGRYEMTTDATFSTDGQIIAIESPQHSKTYVSAKTGKPMADTDIKESLFPLDTKSAKQEARFQGLRLKAISPDGRYIAHYVAPKTQAPGGYYELRDVQSGETVLKLEACDLCRFSADSKILACAQGSGFTGGNTPSSIEFYDLQTKQRLGPPRLRPTRINDMAFAPSGNILAVHYNDSNVILWDARAAR